MAFAPSFTAVQILGQPSQILFTDTSTGSDVNIVSRAIFLKKKDGTFIVPVGTSTQYILWNLSLPSIVVDCLNKDYALQITVEWTDVNGSVLYSANLLQGETLYNETFDYYLSQMMVANPLLINDNNFFQNKSALRTYMDSGNNALINASDIETAQICYDEATNLRLGSQYFYNANS